MRRNLSASGCETANCFSVSFCVHLDISGRESRTRGAQASGPKLTRRSFSFFARHTFPCTHHLITMTSLASHLSSSQNTRVS